MYKNQFNNGEEIETNLKTNKFLNYFWFGFTIYVSAYPIAFGTENASKLFIYTQLAGLLFLVYGAIHLITSRIENKYLKNVFTLYIIWIVFIIVRGISFERSYVIGLLFNANHGILAYFVPLLILFPSDITYLKKVFRVIMILLLVYLIYLGVFYSRILSEVFTSGSVVEYLSALSLPAGYILMSYIYHPGKRTIAALIAVFSTLFIASITARRGLGLISLLVILFFCLGYLLQNKRKLFRNLFLFLVLSGAVFAGYKLYLQNRYGLFIRITERFSQDSRSGVERFFFKDMNTMDWIIGKGLNGKYYCPGIEQHPYTVYRTVIETGYLQIILKGGIISLLLLLLIALPAMIKGLFYSSNMLAKSAGLWILLSILSLYPATVTTFSMSYILFWISVVICYSDKIRFLTDDEVFEAIG
jgi:hypothetical protein